MPGDEVESESEQEMADHFGDALPEPSQLRGADSLGRIRHTLDREAEGEMYDEEEDALVEDRALIVDEQDRQRVRSAGKRPSTEDEADAQAEADYFDDEAEGAVDVDVEPNYDADGYLDEPGALVSPNSDGAEAQRAQLPTLSHRSTLLCPMSKKQSSHRL